MPTELARRGKASPICRFSIERERMILSASRRTDIPCYYSGWFINRLTAGYALARNPMNHAQLSRIPLTPDVVDCIVFWTKDPENIMPHLAAISHMGYRYYFQFTLTPYGGSIEKNLRSKEDIVETFIRLSEAIGKERVLWRYDPIILNNALTVDYHKEHFRRLCEQLHRHTCSVTISFVDSYAKLKTGLIREASEDEMAALGAFIGQTASDYGLTAEACCEKVDLTPYGIRKASCIDKTLAEKICGCPLDLATDRNQRDGCGCVSSIDIGAYDTCLNGCIYCYATRSHDAALARYRLHDPEGEFVIGSVADGDKITDRKVKSHRRNQTTLF